VLDLLPSYGASKPPVWNAQINWAHPFAKKLEFAALFGAGKGSHSPDFVHNFASSSYAGGPSGISTPELGAAGGMHIGYTGSQEGITWVQSTNDSPYLGDITILVRGQFTRPNSGQHNWLNKAGSPTFPQSGIRDCPFYFHDPGAFYNPILIRASHSAQDSFSFSITGNNNQLVSLGVTCSGTNGGACILYYNGASSTSGTSVTNAPYTGTGVAIITGTDRGNSQLTQGNMLHAYIWSRILTPNEMISMWQLPYQFFTPRVLPIGSIVRAIPPMMITPQVITIPLNVMVSVTATAHTP